MHLRSTRKVQRPAFHTIGTLQINHRSRHCVLQCWAASPPRPPSGNSPSSSSEHSPSPLAFASFGRPCPRALNSRMRSCIFALVNSASSSTNVPVELQALMHGNGPGGISSLAFIVSAPVSSGVVRGGSQAAENPQSVPGPRSPSAQYRARPLGARSSRSARDPRTICPCVQKCERPSVASTGSSRVSPLVPSTIAWKLRVQRQRLAEVGQPEIRRIRHAIHNHVAQRALRSGRSKFRIPAIPLKLPRSACSNW